MDENNLTSQPASVPTPISNEIQPPAKPTRPSRWRACAITAGSCLGIVAIIAVVIFILGARGMLSGTPGHINEEPAWSPDGNQIAFTSDRSGNYDIYVMNSDGSNVRQLTSSRYALLYFFLPGNAADYGPAWSPDGQKIAFVSGRSNTSLSFVDTDIYIMDKDGQNVVQWNGSKDNSADKYPEWSPDGSSLIFSSSPNTGGALADVSNIYMAPASPTTKATATNLTMQDMVESDPSWSPDGNQIVFDSLRDDNWHIYAMDKNGSNFVQLTFGNGSESEISPAWSPDGSRIAYTGVLGTRADIYVMNVDGTNIVKLTNGPANSFLPVWSPESRRIAFVSAAVGDNKNENIYVMNADGSNVVQLTH